MSTNDPTAMTGSEHLADFTLPNGEQVGPYRILGVLGEGGFGVVYEADQREPVRRRVALKIIKAGMDSKAVVARFEAERQALALMDHPSVAKVFDGGTTPEGRPYFSMELVRGEAITAFCDRHRLDLEARVELFMRVCEAVQHAHAKGVIHRDLKPSNILVAYEDGRATPKVIDFGVAKALNQRLAEATVFTDQGQLIGTPEYMSPEQAEMGATAIDTRSDVYSLGVVLYELLTGSRPFEGRALREAGLAEIQRVIREVEPQKPSTRLSSLAATEDAPSSASRVAESRRTELRSLTTTLRRDLDWVVMKCLEKDRERRYETPSALSLDLGRYLHHEPVEAGPPDLWYRAQKLVARRRTEVVAAGLIGSALLVAVAALAIGFWSASAGEAAAREAADGERAQRLAAETAERQRAAIAEFFLRDVLGGVDPDVARGEAIELEDVVDRAAERAGSIDDSLVRSAVEGELGSLYYLMNRLESSETFLQRALVSLEASETGAPQEAARLRLRLGRTQQDRGEIEAAGGSMAAAVSSLRAMPDAEAELAGALQALSDLRRRAGDLDGASRLNGEALQLFERQPAAARNAEDYAGVLAGRAFELAECGDLDGAIEFMQRACAVVDESRGSDSVRTANYLGWLGSMQRRAGAYDDAGVSIERSLDIKRSRLRPNDSRIASSLTQLGALELVMGDFEAAERYHREALAIYEQHADEDPLYVARARFAVAQSVGRIAATDRSRLDEALAMLEESIAAYERLGQAVSRTNARLNMARLLSVWDDPRAAEVLRVGREEAIELDHAALMGFAERVGVEHEARRAGEGAD